MRDAEPYEPESEPEPLESPVIPADEAPDFYDDTDTGALRVTSLRPVTRPFSMRRLLNWGSLIVAGITLLALAVAWLPGVLSQHLGSPLAHNRQFIADGIPPARGAGWQSIGPSWAQDVAFAADGDSGYLCGALGPGNAPVLVARFDVGTASKNTWQSFANPATGNHCQIAVSPVDADDVALSVDSCPNPTSGSCSDTYPISQMYRSHDGGTTWTHLPLPAPLAVNSITWANSTLFLRVWGHMDDDNAAPHPLNPEKASAHLLVSRNNGPFTEIGAAPLVGKIAQFDYIALFSSGQTLYAALNSTPCSGYCLTVVHTNDDGAHWNGYAASYADRPITPAFAQPNASVLIGWVFQQSDQMMALLRSFDFGAHWSLLPELPRNPSTGGVTVFATPDGALYVASYGDASMMYELPAGENTWQIVAPMPTGMPLAVQYDASGRAVALWGQAREWVFGSASPGLEYYPLMGQNG